ncbi:uncharacterized protein BDZ83DRAFT_650046 [Colletotrichum acutatum]|uniref:Uncharacterized protein n=1 Tax=Glomerella acutata TaxID=27357 RepID=A0AAD8XJ04_GLOAC|nr:uncharacterized protein BDZ83DRAFT_650046 [Colletotrichum acutatum]KAK1726973.1 hypothetical protein BDZ83DRAFT_650046 [Colletotrichum acutatum]
MHKSSPIQVNPPARQRPPAPAPGTQPRTRSQAQPTWPVEPLLALAIVARCMNLPSTPSLLRITPRILAFALQASGFSSFCHTTNCVRKGPSALPYKVGKPQFSRLRRPTLLSPPHLFLIWSNYLHHRRLLRLGPRAGPTELPEAEGGLRTLKASPDRVQGPFGNPQEPTTPLLQLLSFASARRGALQIDWETLAWLSLFHWSDRPAEHLCYHRLIILSPALLLQLAKSWVQLRPRLARRAPVSVRGSYLLQSNLERNFLDDYPIPVHTPYTVHRTPSSSHKPVLQRLQTQPPVHHQPTRDGVPGDHLNL